MNRIILLSLIVTLTGLLVCLSDAQRHVHCSTNDDCVRSNVCPNPDSNFCDRTGHCRCRSTNNIFCNDNSTCVRSCQRPNACCNRFRRCQCDRPCVN